MAVAHHRAVVLFYRYFIDQQELVSFDVDELYSFCHAICIEHDLKGRLLIATEGINGTVSATDQIQMAKFITAMEGYQQPARSGRRPFYPIDWKISSVPSPSVAGAEYDMIEPFPDLKIRIVPEIISTGGSVSVRDIPTLGGKHLSPREFHEALMSSTKSSSDDDDTTNTTTDNVVLIDVRNTFEHEIGHFVYPSTRSPAWNPETMTFSSFGDIFDAKFKHDMEGLKHKKVLLYCTGGIRCEKASVMLKQRFGIDDVSQLRGGIHRYLELYGDNGFFRGKNFVFDQRVVQTPSDIVLDHQRQQQQQQQQQKKSIKDDDVGDTTTTTHDNNGVSDSSNDGVDYFSDSTITAKEADHHRQQPPDDDVGRGGTVVVGQCFECRVAFDELCGSRICAVCRDLVLVCPVCEMRLREYHCRKHLSWKNCYFYFLDPYDIVSLQDQLHRLGQLFRLELPPNDKRRGDDKSSSSSTTTTTQRSRNVRRTLTKQINKVQDQIAAVGNGQIVPNPRAPKRCRTCFEPRTRCNGRCWGFWKKHAIDAALPPPVLTTTTTTTTSSSTPVDVATALVNSIKPISIGDVVEPGPDWNELRFGSKYTSVTTAVRDESADDDDGRMTTATKPTVSLRRGRVVQLKTWSAGSTGADCAVVLWDDDRAGNDRAAAGRGGQIYRWGALALDGSRIYELSVVGGGGG